MAKITIKNTKDLTALRCISHLISYEQKGSEVMNISLFSHTADELHSKMFQCNKSGGIYIAGCREEEREKPQCCGGCRSVCPQCG